MEYLPEGCSKSFTNSCTAYKHSTWDSTLASIFMYDFNIDKQSLNVSSFSLIIPFDPCKDISINVFVNKRILCLLIEGTLT